MSNPPTSNLQKKTRNVLLTVLLLYINSLTIWLIYQQYSQKISFHVKVQRYWNSLPKYTLDTYKGCGDGGLSIRHIRFTCIFRLPVIPYRPLTICPFDGAKTSNITLSLLEIIGNPIRYFRYVYDSFVSARCVFSKQKI